MIFIIAGTYEQAKKWAKSQHMLEDEWFSSLDLHDLYGRENFHVVVLDSAASLPSRLFEKLWHEAQARGRMNRQ